LKHIATFTLLSVLDEEYRQKRHDRCAGIDDKLLRLGEAEGRHGQCPDNNYQCGNCEPILKPSRPYAMEEQISLGHPRLNLYRYLA
jgi:hypothetical protein